MVRKYKFLVGGEWKESSEQIQIRNPYDESVLGELFQASQGDIDDAVILAQTAFQTFRHSSSYERAAILVNLRHSIEKRHDEFSDLICREAGKPILFARAEVDRAVSTFEIAAEEAKRIDGEIIPLDLSSSQKGRRGYVNRFPIGVIACITPFNFPLNLVAHKIAPAIASGNTFILKPAPQAPLTSLLLGECLLESGLDRRAINVLPCSNERAETLVTDPRIAMLSFTGSATVGWKLKEKAGKKKITLELGGNAAAVVDKGADIKHAVSRCILGAFAYSGQICIKVQRIFIHREIYEQFQRSFLDEVKNVVVGTPLDTKTVVGPLISSAEAHRVETWIREATADGAKLLFGGTRTGSIVQPTVLSDVKPSMKVFAEEVFGPVVTLHVFDTVETAVREMNSSRYGLQAGIFTNDMNSVRTMYRYADVGGVIVNDYPTFRSDAMPYGGVKDSGFGREGVRSAIHEMTEPKLLVLEF